MSGDHNNWEKCSQWNWPIKKDNWNIFTGLLFYLYLLSGSNNWEKCGEWNWPLGRRQLENLCWGVDLYISSFWFYKQIERRSVKLTPWEKTTGKSMQGCGSIYLFFLFLPAVRKEVSNYWPLGRGQMNNLFWVVDISISSLRSLPQSDIWSVKTVL